MATRIYTRGGDGGDTGLIGGSRRQKDSPRIEAYGDVDELCASLGVVLAETLPDAIAEPVRRIQALLFALGAELATPSDAKKKPAGVTAEDVTDLEGVIDSFDNRLPPLKSFILPGGSRAGAALHLARTVCRRAERRVVTLRAEEPEVSLITVRFLNRLSDLLFVLAREANRVVGVDDISWHPRA